MNEHLRLIFVSFLPALEKAEIDYWVYGGISVAAYVGRYIRENDDVDIFVKEPDFERTISTLELVCRANPGCGLKERKPLECDGYKRRKIDLKVNGAERLSVIPLLPKDNDFVLVFNGIKRYPKTAIYKVARNIEGYKFTTCSNELTKDLFVYCLPYRIRGKSKDKVKLDAKAVLTPQEFNKFYPN